MSGDDSIYGWTYAIAAEYGTDVAIETAAECYDAICPGIGLGDVLRRLWADIRGDLVRTPAHLSGAADELEFYA